MQFAVLSQVGGGRAAPGQNPSWSTQAGEGKVLADALMCDAAPLLISSKHTGTWTISVKGWCCGAGVDSLRNTLLCKIA